jgi:hypothetical protein
MKDITYHKLSKKSVFLCILFLIAFAERVFFDMGPNFELVTTVLILSAFYIGRKASFWIVFLIMLLSDLVIGNTNIFIFTWSGFLLPALLLKKVRIESFFSKITTGTSLGIIANGFFYIWTNFGVWLLSGMYPKTAPGLLMSYINALPFLRYQFVSTLIFVPLGFVIAELTILIHKKFKFGNILNKALS